MGTLWTDPNDAWIVAVSLLCALAALLAYALARTADDRED